jgi:hypothetical protein
LRRAALYGLVESLSVLLCLLEHRADHHVGYRRVTRIVVRPSRAAVLLKFKRQLGFGFWEEVGYLDF